MERQPYAPPGSFVANNSQRPASVETFQGGVPPYGVKETLVVNGTKMHEFACKRRSTWQTQWHQMNTTGPRGVCTSQSDKYWFGIRTDITTEWYSLVLEKNGWSHSRACQLQSNSKPEPSKVIDAVETFGGVA